MDNTHCFSFAPSSATSGSSNQFKIPDLRDISPSKILTGSHQSNFISLTINKDKWSPIMPTVTPFISPYTASTATLAITSLADNDTSSVNIPPSMINENFTAASAGIIEQDHKLINDHGRINNNNDNFFRPYTYNTGDNTAHCTYDTTTTKINHLIHINPSIVSSEDRAFYHSDGTSMTNLLQDYYLHQSLNWKNPTQITDITPMKKEPSRGKKNKGSKSGTKQSAIVQQGKSKISEKFISNTQLKNKRKKKSKNTSSIAPNKSENVIVDGCKNKKVDARLWLNAKSKLPTRAQKKATRTSKSSSSACSIAKRETKDFPSKFNSRFIDRATSPINFAQNKTIIKPNKTRDIALSPIRLIEPQLKYRSHSDEEMKMNSSSLSQTIESANKMKALNRLFDSQHNCEICIAMSRQMTEPICSICGGKEIARE